MTDTDTATQKDDAWLDIPVSKAKASVRINVKELSDEVYKEIILQGLKVLVNRGGVAKITAKNTAGPDDMKAKALAAAEANVEKIMAGEIRATGGKAKSKITGATKTEAMRLARNAVKDELKRVGLKVSHYKASQITELAEELLAKDPTLIDQAQANLAAREAAVGTSKVASLGIDVKKAKADPTLVAKAAAKTKTGEGQLSAKQAGMVGKVVPKAKPTAQPQARH